MAKKLINNDINIRLLKVIIVISLWITGNFHIFLREIQNVILNSNYKKVE